MKDEIAIKELQGTKDFPKIAEKATTKKKVRVKRSKDPNTIEEEKPREEEEKKQMEGLYTGTKADNRAAADMIQIGELLNDLTLNDAQCGDPDTISDVVVDEFIKRIKQIYIEKC